MHIAAFKQVAGTSLVIWSLSFRCPPTLIIAWARELEQAGSPDLEKKRLRQQLRGKPFVVAAERSSGGKEARGLIAATKRWDFLLNVGSELQAEARGHQQIARGGQCDGVQDQRIEIRRKEQGVWQDRAERLQHEQFVVQIGAEYPYRLNTSPIFRS